MNKSKIGLAVAQVGGIDLAESRADVIKRLLELLREAAGRGSEFVVFPELTLTTFFPRYWYDDAAEADRFFETEMPNGAVAPLFEEAVRLGVGFYLGYAELTPEGRHFNTSIMVNQSGRIVGKYRKIHLPGHDEKLKNVAFQHLEKRYFEPGDMGFGVWDLDGTAAGMCICNDRRWPETWRVLALQGAKLGFVGYNTPSAAVRSSEPSHLAVPQHVLSIQAAAYQNSMWIGSAAKSGYEDGYHMIAGSVICSPSGEVVARTTSEDDEVITYNIDLALGENYALDVFNFARHRRTQEYGLILERTAPGLPVYGQESVSASRL